MPRTFYAVILFTFIIVRLLINHATIGGQYTHQSQGFKPDPGVSNLLTL